ncbi:MAG: hypothetical protein Q9220_007583 [cf. Caloplaca sp. 1 TL-2023]
MDERTPQYPLDLEDCSPASTIDKPTANRWRRHFGTKIENHNSDHILLLCWFTTGLLDSTIFNAYRTFVSMQTGASNYNTTTRPYGWAKSLTSLICFITGAYFFSRFGAYFQPSRRSTLALSFLIQAAVILLCAILVEASVIEGRLEYIGDDIDWIHIIPIMLLSFQAPGQVWLSRDLKFNEVSTVVVSTMLYDFGADPKLFARLGENRVRNRRIGGFCCLLVGAVMGGWVTKQSGHIGIPMWVAGAIKLGITVAWAVWPAEESVRRWGT